MEDMHKLTAQPHDLQFIASNNGKESFNHAKLRSGPSSKTIQPYGTIISQRPLP
jgi:hypothetical protein